MTTFTRDELLQRGWSVEHINCFASKGHEKSKTNEPLWKESIIQKIEDTLSFKNFINNTEYKEREDKVLRDLKIKEEEGIALVNGLKVEFKEHNCLLNNTENYNCLKPIIHFTKDNFYPEESSSYSLFTDGCFKTIGRQSFSSCAGWVLNNETQEIVAEFSKSIELNVEQKRGMPDFELLGIVEGVKLIKLLGLKNVQCFTDSIGEAKTILSALHNIGDGRFEEYKDLYAEVTNTLKETSSSIAWIPREYNSHADMLTKIPLKAWTKEYEKEYIAQDYMKDVGYVVNREKEIFFHQNKMEYCDPKNLKAEHTLFVLNYNKKDVMVLLHNNTSNTFEIISQEKRDFSYIDNITDKEVKSLKQTKPDGMNLIHLCKGITKLKNLKALNICAPKGVMAVFKKYAPIHYALQEEFFEFHKTCHDFKGKLYITETNNTLNRNVDDFIASLKNGDKKKTSP